LFTLVISIYKFEGYAFLNDMGKTYSTHGTKRNAYKILIGKPKGKSPLGRPRSSLVNTIKMDLRRIGWCDMDWIDLAQDRDQWRALVNAVINLRVP
jgi:hypothetical protein